MMRLSFLRGSGVSRMVLVKATPREGVAEGSRQRVSFAPAENDIHILSTALDAGTKAVFSVPKTPLSPTTSYAPVCISTVDPPNLLNVSCQSTPIQPSRFSDQIYLLVVLSDGRTPEV